MADWKEVKEIKIVVAVVESEEMVPQQLVPNQGRCTIFHLHAQPPPPVFSSLDGTGYVFSGNVLAAVEKYNQELNGTGYGEGKNALRKLPTVQMKVEKVVGKGDARDLICSMVDKLGADLVVMGSHGYGFVERALLGSVSDHLAKKAKCPVLIVKSPKIKPREVAA